MKQKPTPEIWSKHIDIRRDPNSAKPSAFSQNGMRALMETKSGILSFWDLDQNKELFHLNGHKGNVQDIQMSADAMRAVSCSIEKGSNSNRPNPELWSTFIWDLQRKKGRKINSGYKNEVTCVAISADRTVLLFGLLQGGVYLISGNNVNLIGRYEETPSHVYISNDNALGMSISENEIFLWDLKIANRLSSFSKKPRSLGFLPVEFRTKLLNLGFDDLDFRTDGTKRLVSNYTSDRKSIVSIMSDGAVIHYSAASSKIEKDSAYDSTGLKANFHQ